MQINPKLHLVDDIKIKNRLVHCVAKQVTGVINILA